MQEPLDAAGRGRRVVSLPDLSESYRWEELEGLVPRRLQSNPERICTAVRKRFAFLTFTSEEEAALLHDQASHREVELFLRLRPEARELSASGR